MEKALYLSEWDSWTWSVVPVGRAAVELGEPWPHCMRPQSICDTTDHTGLPSKAAAVVSSRYKERKEPDQALWWFTANRKTKPHSRDGKL